MREAGQDELVDAEPPVAKQLSRDLFRVADYCRAAVDSHGGDAIPQMVADPVVFDYSGLRSLSDHCGACERRAPLLFHYRRRFG